MPKPPEVLKKHGETMITLTVKFFTDHLAKDPNMVRRKHAYTCGAVYMTKNETHGTRSGKTFKFNSMAELPLAMQKCLIAHDITLHPSKNDRKIFKIEN
jgi:hypothetical protein